MIPGEVFLTDLLQEKLKTEPCLINFAAEKKSQTTFFASEIL